LLVGKEAVVLSVKLSITPVLKTWQQQQQEEEEEEGWQLLLALLGCLPLGEDFRLQHLQHHRPRSAGKRAARHQHLLP